jgi:hypothetical protein
MLQVRLDCACLLFEPVSFLAGDGMAVLDDAMLHLFS